MLVGGLGLVLGLYLQYRFSACELGWCSLQSSLSSMTHLPSPISRLAWS